MNSKNPRHNSVRIVRRDYCYSGTCQSQCSALEDILLSINAETTYHSSKRNVFFVERKRQNKNKTKKNTETAWKTIFSLLWNSAAVTIEVPHHRQLCRNVQNFQIPDISSWWNVFQSVFWGLWKSRQMMISIIIFNSTLPCGVWYECRLPCRGWNCSDSRKRLSWSMAC